MTYRLSDSDRAFRDGFTTGAVSLADFDHRGHLRLAYVHLVGHSTEEALASIRDALLGFLDHHGIDRAKYHETITRAWVMAVRHFMEKGDGASDADGFIDAHPQMLDSGIMLTHYSAEVLFSDSARAAFVEPDLDEIPRHA